MHIVIVYESMFGNTRHIAESIADGARELHQTNVFHVGSVDPQAVEDADLLVIGAPTHAWSLSRPATRQSAASRPPSPRAVCVWKAPPPAPGSGSGWTAGQSCPRGGVFDTRLHTSALLSGRAGRAVVGELRKRRVQLVADAESFLVDRKNHSSRGSWTAPGTGDIPWRSTQNRSACAGISTNSDECPMGVAAVAEVRRRSWAGRASLVAGGLLIGWILAQWLVMQRLFYLQPVTFAAGVAVLSA